MNQALFARCCCVPEPQPSNTRMSTNFFGTRSILHSANDLHQSLIAGWHGFTGRLFELPLCFTGIGF